MNRRNFAKKLIAGAVGAGLAKVFQAMPEPQRLVCAMDPAFGSGWFVVTRSAWINGQYHIIDTQTFGSPPTIDPETIENFKAKIDSIWEDRHAPSPATQTTRP